MNELYDALKIKPKLVVHDKNIVVTLEWYNVRTSEVSNTILITTSQVWIEISENMTFHYSPGANFLEVWLK